MQTASTTLEQLKLAMAQKGDLPCVSAALSRIVNSMQGDDTSTDEQMVDVVLSDFALSQKVLRLANSAMYSAFGGSITTISMAIYVLGTEAVGHLAMGLKLLDNLGQAAETESARDELSKAVVSGAIARNVAASVSGKAGESVAVATLMRSLGKLLVCFYLPDLFKVITQSKPSVDAEDEAARNVLGLTFSEVADQISRSWSMPDELTSYTSEPGLDASSHAKWVHSVAGYSRNYVAAIASGASEDELRRLASRYSEAIGSPTTELLKQAHSAVEAAKGNGSEDSGASVLWDTRKRDAAPEESMLSKLTTGIDELERVKDTLSVVQVLSMATEVLWKSLNCSKALFFLRSAQSTYECMLGRGDGMQALVKKVRFEEAFSPNVFHIALANTKPVYLANAMDPNIQRRIPAWLAESVPPAKTIFLLPFTLNGKSNSILYLDWGPEAAKTGLTGEELAQVERLRTLVSNSMQRAVAARTRATVPA